MTRLRIGFAAFFMANACANAGAQTIPREPEAYRPDEIKIGLQREACFGACPVYTIDINGDGVVKYFGSQWVGVEGSRENKISTGQVELLVNAFLRAHFFDLLHTYRGFEVVKFNDGKYERYGRGIDHGLGVILLLELGQRKKQIIVHYGYPEELKDLADLIDTVTQSVRWTARANDAAVSPTCLPTEIRASP